MKAFLFLIAFIGSASAAAIPYVGNPYKDFIGRGYALPLAAAAYSDSPKDCLSNMTYSGGKKYDMLFNRQRFAVCGENILFQNETCSGYTAVDRTSGIIIVSFRGTATKLQLVTEWWEDNEFHDLIGGQVARYFFEAFDGLWNGKQLKDDFITLRNRYPKYTVYFIGHSLGGAMASIAAATVVSTGLKHADKVVLLTMGQPRTGDLAYAKAFDALKIESYRIIHQGDPVPHLPPLDVYGYHHHLSEVWYDNDMLLHQNFIVCDQVEEDTKCSDGLSDWNYLTIDEHTHYFNEYVSEYGENKCQHVPEKAKTDADSKLADEYLKKLKNKYPSDWETLARGNGPSKIPMQKTVNVN